MNNELCNNFHVVCPMVDDGFHVCIATTVRNNEYSYDFKITFPN